MKSVTQFFRRKGYALREIERLLQELVPTAGHVATESGKGCLINEIFHQLQHEPLIENLAQDRSTLTEVGIQPFTEHSHTLKIPVSRQPGSKRLCFTRVGPDRWAWFVEESHPEISS